MKRIRIYDESQGKNIDVEIIRSERIDDGVWHLVDYYIPDRDQYTIRDGLYLKFAVIEHDDGTIVSQNDWQAEPVTVDEISESRWVDVSPVTDVYSIRGTELNMQRYASDGSTYYDDEELDYTPSRAEFRALRESVGMTQQLLADELGVQVRSVKRWEQENPNGWYEPPRDAWDILYDALEIQKKAILESVKKVKEIEDAHGKPDKIVLSYWLSQADYISWSSDAQLDTVGDWRMANANTRAVAAVLRHRGYEVVFANGSPAANPPADV